MAHNAPMSEIAAVSNVAPYPVAVIMERVRYHDRWATERWDAKGVVCDADPPGGGERVLVSDERVTQMLFPGFQLKLHPDEAEGYLYNITSPQPKVFVMWRVGEDGMARPQSLTVSYHEGARWMDAEETVAGVALPPDLMPWIEAFAAAHYKPEPKKKRYASSKDKGVASHREGAK